MGLVRGADLGGRQRSPVAPLTCTSGFLEGASPKVTERGPATCEGCLPLPRRPGCQHLLSWPFSGRQLRPSPSLPRNGSAAPTAERRDASILNTASTGGPPRSRLVSGSLLVVTSRHARPDSLTLWSVALWILDKHCQHLTGYRILLCSSPFDMHI